MEGFWHDSRSEGSRFPVGAVPCGQAVRLRLWGPPPREGERCLLQLQMEQDGPPEYREMAYTHPAGEGQPGCYALEVAMPGQPGLVWYSFMLLLQGGPQYYGNNDQQTGGGGRLWAQQPPGFQITVYQAGDQLPGWYRQGVIYQIFPDRFFRGPLALEPGAQRENSFLHLCWQDPPLYLKDEKGRISHWTYHGGNLPGVVEKLPYLKGLGVSILYFNPLFEANSNHKYNTADYLKIDRMFGGNEAFARLCRAAQAAGMAVILDGVFSHTGSDSIYFNQKGTYPGLGACQGEGSPYFKWYRFKKFPDSYECWWGIDDLPNVQEMEPSYLEFIASGEGSVVRRWLEAGASGWRLDVADELPDDFIREVRKAMQQQKPDAVLIGEVWEDASNKVSYGAHRKYLLGGMLHSVMNYPFRQAVLDYLLGKATAYETVGKLHQQWENYPPTAFYGAMNLLGSHDTPRLLTLLGEAPPDQDWPQEKRRRYRLPAGQRALGLQRLRLAAAFQLLYPGVPSIYYGDEAGMEGFSDPYNRGPFPWGLEERGLSDWYRRLLRLRAEEAVFSSESFYPLALGENLLAYWRWQGEVRALVVLNPSAGRGESLFLQPLMAQPPFAPQAGEEGAWRVFDLLEGSGFLPLDSLPVQEVAPLSCRVWLLEKGQLAPLCQPLCRQVGLLLPLGSLPGEGMGEEAFSWIDRMAQAGVGIWQMLPLTPVDGAGSPYQPDSVMAGNPGLISRRRLVEEGLLTAQEAALPQEQWLAASCRRAQGAPFGAVWQAFSGFCRRQAAWLEDYALYRALCSHLGVGRWQDFPAPLARRDPAALQKARCQLADAMQQVRWAQFLFDRQLAALHAHAARQGVQLVGDLAFGVDAGGCDCWANRCLFWLDEEGGMSHGMGVPPDAFSEQGQNWQLPLYHWEAMKREDYRWWRQRLERWLAYFDRLRLDHFRGFEAAWAIPAGQKAADGFWMKGPGVGFFQSLARQMGPLPLFCEDLGIITPQVHLLRRRVGAAGMCVAQFCPEGQLPPGLEEQTALYPGTHDNQTLAGWLKAGHPDWDACRLGQQVRSQLAQLLESRCAWVVIPAQDVLGLGDEARINTPGTVQGNWQWKMTPAQLQGFDWEWLAGLAARTGRLQDAAARCRRKEG